MVQIRFWTLTLKTGPLTLVHSACLNQVNFYMGEKGKKKRMSLPRVISQLVVKNKTKQCAHLFIDKIVATLPLKKKNPQWSQI